ncbi:hypothetical protein N7G274_001733 [Stereocaulon virgatum]|uniref:Uncharacterized protein n=1 Tax=Stereocaulon virgatum TaxID=373712 RepID=A0ABR4ALB9_9LECA
MTKHLCSVDFMPLGIGRPPKSLWVQISRQIRGQDHETFIFSVPTWKSNMSKSTAKLTQSNLTRHIESQKAQEGASEKQMMKRFQEENDSYRGFLATGVSSYRKGEQATNARRSNSQGCGDQGPAVEGSGFRKTI